MDTLRGEGYLRLCIKIREEFTTEMLVSCFCDFCGMSQSVSGVGLLYRAI